MSLKKYIGAIVIILILLGIVNQQQVVVHNQEIVLEFNEANVSEVDTEVAISILKKELQYLGVTDFRVVENNDGKLKITYYSNTDVSSVKRILLKKIRAELNTSDDEDAPFNVPFEDNDVAYNFDVHEIQNTDATDSGLNGIEVLELKPKTDRLFKPKIIVSVITEYSKKEDVNFKVAFHLHKNSLHALQHALQQIPEVRAGPDC